jgi:hypothetical protein
MTGNDKIIKPDKADLTNSEAEANALVRTPDLTETKEGASAFKVNDPFVTLLFNKGSYMPNSEMFYSTPEGELLGFVAAIQAAAKVHPELALQYAAWQRDPRKGKGNRSQPPWAIAALAAVKECVEHPRFVELVAKCIVRPDDAMQIVQASHQLLGDNNLPPELKKGIAKGLEKMSAYQLAKYANDRLNLLPQKREKTGKPKLPNPRVNPQAKAIEKAVIPEPIPIKTLRFADVLGICKHELSPRLFRLYRYLHAPTRMQAGLLPMVSQDLPQLIAQKDLRSNPPGSSGEVADWVKQALNSRMTMEQMLSASGMPQGTRKQLKELSAGEQTSMDKAQLEPLKKQELASRAVKGEIWKNIMAATVPDEERPEKTVPFLGDTAFLRNIRGMHQAGIALEDLKAEAKRRKFSGIYPYQILAAANKIEEGNRRGDYTSTKHPVILPVLDIIFERIAVASLPRKTDGNLWKLLGMADISGSMMVKIGSPSSSATCMDASLAFSAAFALTTRTENYAGIAGTWGNKFFPAESEPNADPLQIIKNVIAQTEGWGGGGTQVFGSMLNLINWLKERPHVPRPEAIVILSDMQFHPPEKLSEHELNLVPDKFKKLIQRPEFKKMPPLASAIVLYREILGSDVSLILWNLATYAGSPVPGGMDRVLLLSGFDTNTFKIVETWLNAGSPGTAMPEDAAKSVASGDSNSSLETVLAALRQY